MLTITFVAGELLFELPRRTQNLLPALGLNPFGSFSHVAHLLEILSGDKITTVNLHSHPTCIPSAARFAYNGYKMLQGTLWRGRA